MTHQGRKPTRKTRAMVRVFVLLVYVALVVISHWVQRAGDNPASTGSNTPSPTERALAGQPNFVATHRTTIPAMGKQGPVGGTTIELASIEWAPATRSDRPWVIMLHGSPGQATNFARLGPALAAQGDSVLAIDLPGFGDSTALVPDYSVRAAARSVLALMDERGIDRAHIVGWSNGGGVAINIADLAPDRVATVTLIASTGSQRTEGSGDYYFEHAKYALGYGALVLLPEVLPHFGVLGDFAFRRAFIRSFWDTDQRPFEAMMQRLKPPVLILHGRHDPLVADWAAEEHHRLMPTSRLVMLDASHFLPFMQVEQTAGYMDAFFRRHDLPGVEPQTDAQILAPKRPGMFGAVGARLARVPRDWPWWVSALGVGALAFVLPRTAIASAGLATGLMHLDIGVALVGLVLGRSFRSRPGRSAKRWLALVVGTLVLLMIASPMAPALAQRGSDAAGIVGAIVGVLLVALSLHVLVAVVRLLLMVRLVFTWRGRGLLKARLVRIVRREYWPIWAIYLPILPHLMRLSLRHRNPLVFTACNPAIGNGGGIVGESKYDIMQGLQHAGERALHAVLFERGKPDVRANLAIERIQSDPKLSGFPVVLKPNAGQRGEGVVIARDEQEVRDYFHAARSAIVVQRYHPGPMECGVLWCRNTATDADAADPTDGQRTGTILSITRKTFPHVRGDAGHTIEQLLYANPRFATHARTLLDRLNDDPQRVPADGERVRLSQIGCHSGGTIFRDGTDLITPELLRTIDEISRQFPSTEGGGLDVGRFDIRYESDELLKQGKGFAIVELNGVTGESTNLYDPDKSLAWAVGVMKVHWTRMYALGAQRRENGHKPLNLLQLLLLVARPARLKT
jgi:pimeloyl-ACP methyl ester carboxylesterase